MLALSLLTLGMVAVATAGVVPEMIETRNAKGETIHLPLAPASMTGPIQLGGPNMTFTGQHFEIEAEIAKLNPYWSNMTEAELDLLEPGARLDPSAPQSETHSLQARSNRVAHWCSNGFAYADFAGTMTNLGYLSRRFPPGMYCQAPARSCARYACFTNAAVLLCSTYIYQSKSPTEPR